MFDIDDIRGALAGSPSGRDGGQSRAEGGRAAVALVLAGQDQALRLCIIRRAENGGDPWAGHLAFPGGRVAAEDRDLQATAERETREEIGLLLQPAWCLGPLASLGIWLSGRERRLFIHPFVYYVGSGSLTLVPNHEVEEAYWLPLSHAWEERNATSLRLVGDEVSLVYPAIRFGEHLIWGITLRVLTLFSDVLGHPLPHLEQIPGLGHKWATEPRA